MKQKVRDLIIYTGLFAEPQYNAAGKRVYGNSLILEALGFDVLILGKSQEEQYRGRKQYTEHIFFESYPDYGRIRYHGYISYLKRIIDEQPKQPVCIIRYGAPGLSFFDNELLKLAHGKGIKVVADVADWLSSDGGNYFFNTIKTIDTYMEKAIYNNKSDGIIAVSNYLYKYYRHRVNNVVVIPPIAPLYRPNISNNSVVRVIYAGVPFRMGLRVKNVHKIKDRLDIAIESMAAVYLNGFRKFVFQIYGITKDQYLIAFPQHKSIIEQTKNVILFFGRRPMPEIQDELVKADFSILLREVTRGTTAGFPTKVVECMSCGTPMITTNTSDLSNYIDHGKNGFFVDITDMKKLVVQLTEILKISPDNLLMIKDNCYRAKQFLPEAYEEQMKVFMENLLN